MKRSILPVIKILSILFVPGVIPIYLATIIAKKENLQKLKTFKLRVEENYHSL